MRVLVIGGSGQVGRRLVRLLPGAVAPPHRDLDLADEAALRRFLRAERFDTIVVPGAASNIDWCEAHPEEAAATNAIGPGVVAEESRGAHVVFFSTDAVFDGLAGPYRPEDVPNPISVYGSTKVEGERRVRAARRWTVIRTCQVYGCDPGRGLVVQIAEKLAAGQTALGWTDSWGTMTDADDLAEATVRAIGEGRTGILHLAGRDFITRYEFSLEVGRQLGRPDLIVGGPTDRPNRPKRTGLVSNLIGYREGIARQLRLYANSSSRV